MKLRDTFRKERNWEAYKSERNRVTNMIKQKKKKVMSNLISNVKNNNTKPIWEALNIKSRKIQVSKNDLNITGENLNSHFTTVAEKLFAALDKVENTNFEEQIAGIFNATEKELNLFPKFTPFLVCCYIKSIPINKSTGTDSISIKMLRRTLPFVINVITDMFNRILMEGTFPDVWMMSLSSYY